MAVFQDLFRNIELLLDSRTIFLAVVVFVLLVLITHSYLFQVKDLPPGPKAWPLVGCVPQLMYMSITAKPKTVQGLYYALHQKYGPVCCLSLPFPFGTRMVIVNGYKAVYESLVSPDFNQRPSMVLHGHNNELLDGTGIIFSSGDLWKEHRRFSLTVLRGFGVGKRSFENQIATESECLMKEISCGEGKPFDPSYLFCNAVSNVICSVVFGKRFEYDDSEYRLLLHWLEDFTNHPWAGLLYFAMPKLFSYMLKIPFFPKGALPSKIALRQKFQDYADEHRNTLDIDDMRDYVDVYLNEIQAKKDRGEQTYLNETELRAVLHDFFLAGTDTTSYTLRWGLLFMMKFPDVQKRVHEEIDRVVGKNRLPQLTDKPNLPYTQAVIHEIQRFGSIVLSTGPRYVSQDTKFEGFTVPKGAVVLTILHSALRDPSVWEDPDNFKPERFLDDNGEVVKIPEQIVFGAGKRVCLGEQLARMELFIFFTHLMHRFSFQKPTATDELNLDSQPSMIRQPHPYKIRAIPRQ